MKVALDTNVLAYAEGTNGAAMRDRALQVIQRLPVGAVVLPVQTLGELFNVLVRKAKRRPARARAAVLSWRDAYPMVETSACVMVDACLPSAPTRGGRRATIKWLYMHLTSHRPMLRDCGSKP